MQCHHCSKIMNEKPWLTCKNVDNSHINLCSYICTRRFPLTPYHHKNIVNKEDFEIYLKLQPVKFSKETRYILTIDEEKKLSSSELKKYKESLDEIFFNNPELMNVYYEQIDFEETERNIKNT